MPPISSTADLIKRLQHTLVKQRIILFAAGLLTSLAVVIAAWLLLSIVAQVMIVPVWLKIGLISLAGIVSATAFARFALVRLWSGSLDGVAVALEQRNPSLKGVLVAAIDFEQNGVAPGFSHELVEATHIAAVRSAGGVNTNEVVSFHPVLRTTKSLGAATVAALVALLLIPGLFQHAFEVYSNPTLLVAPPLAYTVTATPGTGEWTKYTDLTLGATIAGQRIPDDATLHYRLVGGSWQTEEFDLEAMQRGSIGLSDSITVGHTIRQIARSVEFFVEAGRVTSERQEITVVDRPRVEEINLTIFSPPYTELSPQSIDEQTGSFSAIVGSRVNLELAANLPIVGAELVFADSSRQPLTVEGATAKTSIIVDESKSYHIRLIDNLSQMNPDPIEYYITATPDEYPSIEVVKPGFDVNLTDDMRLPLFLRIWDDFGFSSLVMKFVTVADGRASDEQVAVLSFSDKIKTEGDIEWSWNLDQLSLLPGDFVQYWFEIADNDQISGPKVSTSRKYLARVPSLEELTSRSERQGEERISKTEDVLRQGRDLLQRLKDAGRKIESELQEKQADSDWQQKKELEQILQQNQEMTEKVEELAESMQESVEELRENALMSREILEKMEEIRELFEEVATQEMREAQERMLEALQEMNRNELQDAMEQFELSQEEMLDRLERTAELLKRMQVEQKMEAMVRRAEQLLEEQTRLDDEIQQRDAEDLPELEGAQDGIRERLEDLKKEASELEELLKEAELEENEFAKKFSEALEQNDADQDMQESSEAMNQQEKSDAEESSDEAKRKLADMLSEMQEQQMAMTGQQSQEIQNAMRRVIEDANTLSLTQESLREEATDIQANSMIQREIAQQQQDVAQATEGLRRSIAAIGKATPFVASELGRIVEMAITEMDNATEQFDSRSGTRAANHQREAMIYLNKVASRMMESLNEQKQCENPSDGAQGMQKLEELAQRQQRLNQESEGMCDNPSMQPGQGKQPMPGSPGQGQGQQGQGNQDGQMRDLAGLKRLAGEQGSIRKSMEQLAEEMGNNRQLLGRLDEIAKEMKKVEEALESGEIGEETAQRQLRIYSRMLEATRSLQRRDYTNERRARTAETAPTFLPPELSPEVLGDRGQFEDRLRRYLGENYPRQYEEQIKAYFRALLKAETDSDAVVPSPETEN